MIMREMFGYYILLSYGSIFMFYLFMLIILYLNGSLFKRIYSYIYYKLPNDLYETQVVVILTTIVPFVFLPIILIYIIVNNILSKINKTIN